MPDVPIIGRGYEPLTWYPTSLVKCNCRAGELTLVIITGWNNVVVCPKCRKGYFNKQLRGQEIEVGCIIPTPTDKVM